MENDIIRLMNKLPYSEPEVIRIEIAAEEVMAVGCKLPSAGTAVGPPNCPANNCVEPGS